MSANVHLMQFTQVESTDSHVQCGPRISQRWGSKQLFQPFFPENCMTLNRIGPKRALPKIPLRSATDVCLKSSSNHCWYTDQLSRETREICSSYMYVSGRYWYFLHLFLNVSLKSLLLFNNQLVLIYLYHIWVKIASNCIHLLFKLKYFPQYCHISVYSLSKLLFLLFITVL